MALENKNKKDSGPHIGQVNESRQHGQKHVHAADSASGNFTKQKTTNSTGPKKTKE